MTLYNVITESACLSIWVVFHERGKSMNLQTHTSHHNDVTMSTIASQITSLTIAHSTVCPCVNHYDDVTMTATASLITSLTIVYSTVYSSADQRKHQSSASLAFVRGIHRRPVNSPHKWPVTRKMSPFDEVIMSKKPSKLRVVVHCAWNSSVIGEFPTQMDSNTENDSIWRRYHVH